MTVPSPLIRPEEPADAAAIERLHARAFGPGRFARTAYRLREGAAAMREFGFVALIGTDLAGSIRIGPAETEAGHPLLVLGPLAVDPGRWGRGLGSGLMEAGLAAADGAGHDLVILVGDAPFYRRFGFAPVPPGRLALPGPVDPARLLWRERAEGAAQEAHGLVRARRRGTGAI